MSASQPPASAPARDVLFACQPGPQTRLVQCPAEDILFGGARGGGKTLGSILDWLAFCARNRGKSPIGVWWRRTIPEIEGAQAQMIRVLPLAGATYLAAQRTWQMACGAQLKLRYIETDADATRYQGHEYQWFCFDDMGTWPRPDPIDMLRACLRSSSGIRSRMISSANPGGVGHDWIKARYLDPSPPNRIFTGADGVTRAYIPSRLRDNPKLVEADPDYMRKLAASGPPWLVRAWLDGDWDASREGAIIKREWLMTTYDALPRLDRPGPQIVVSCDTAHKVGSSADYSAMVVLVVEGHYVHVAEVVRKKLAFPDLAREVQALCDRWGGYKHCPLRVLIEDKASGQDLIPYLRQLPSWRHSIIAVKPSGTKYERMSAQLHWLEGGRLRLPKSAPWLRDFTGELLAFDDHRPAPHDDQVDALSQGLAYLGGSTWLPGGLYG